jgi:hypothetical protein
VESFFLLSKFSGRFFFGVSASDFLPACSPLEADAKVRSIPQSAKASSNFFPKFLIPQYSPPKTRLFDPEWAFHCTRRFGANGRRRGMGRGGERPFPSARVRWEGMLGSKKIFLPK